MSEVVGGGTLTPIGGELTPSNSYVTYAEATDYLALSIEADVWHRASEPHKVAALVMATRRIDALRLKGVKYDDSQPLAFPRRNWERGRFTGDGEVPAEIKAAQCEEALAILRGGSGGGKRRQLQAEGVRSFKVGDFSETFAPGATSGSRAALQSLMASILMAPYTAGGVPVV